MVLVWLKLFWNWLTHFKEFWPLAAPIVSKLLKNISLAPLSVIVEYTCNACSAS